MGKAPSGTFEGDCDLVGLTSSGPRSSLRDGCPSRPDGAQIVAEPLVLPGDLWRGGLKCLVAAPLLGICLGLSARARIESTTSEMAWLQEHSERLEDARRNELIRKHTAGSGGSGQQEGRAQPCESAGSKQVTFDSAAIAHDHFASWSSAKSVVIGDGPLSDDDLDD